MTLLRWILVVVFAMCAAGHASAATNFANGNQAYEKGDFEQAAALYEKDVKADVVHESVFYNLGNAYFRLGELGRAIYNYERALRIDPDMSVASYNLEVAREVVAERIRDRLKGAERDPLWLRVSTYFTISQLTIAVLALNLVFFMLLVVLRFLDSGFRRTVSLVINSFVAGSLVLAVLVFGGHVYYLQRIKVGIVLGEQVLMREGANTDRAERGQLHAGLRVQILDTAPGWLRIRLSNGVEGWVKGQEIGLL